jgi:hypothetical protein
MYLVFTCCGATVAMSVERVMAMQVKIKGTALPGLSKREATKKIPCVWYLKYNLFLCPFSE